MLSPYQQTLFERTYGSALSYRLTVALFLSSPSVGLCSDQETATRDERSHSRYVCINEVVDFSNSYDLNSYDLVPIIIVIIAKMVCNFEILMHFHCYYYWCSYYCCYYWCSYYCCCYYIFLLCNYENLTEATPILDCYRTINHTYGIYLCTCS